MVGRLSSAARIPLPGARRWATVALSCDSFVLSLMKDSRIEEIQASCLAWSFGDFLESYG
jgi:hypothetical protein